MRPEPLSHYDFLTLLDGLREESAHLERSNCWPDSSWRRLADAGILQWFLPVEFGGTDADDATRQGAYLELASACLTTAFILTQRNAAVARILISDNLPLTQTLATQLAANKIFATVGISHLTTSRQHLNKPPVEAEPVAGGWIFQGEVPWVTGASRADIIVTGGVLPDGLQILIALDTTSAGVMVQEPPRLLALNESFTASVTLADVFVPTSRLLLGPDGNVLKAGGAGGVTTSALGLGAAQKSIRGIEAEARDRSELESTGSDLRETLEALKRELYDAVIADQKPTKETLDDLRRRSNSLALRSAQAYLTACKGAGFLEAHPASRQIREAQFFLVWSCPQPVMAAALAEFACPTP